MVNTKVFEQGMEGGLQVLEKVLDRLENVAVGKHPSGAFTLSGFGDKIVITPTSSGKSWKVQRQYPYSITKDLGLYGEFELDQLITWVERWAEDRRPAGNIL